MFKVAGRFYLVMGYGFHRGSGVLLFVPDEPGILLPIFRWRQIRRAQAAFFRQTIAVAVGCPSVTASAFAGDYGLALLSCYPTVNPL